MGRKQCILDHPSIHASFPPTKVSHVAYGLLLSMKFSGLIIASVQFCKSDPPPHPWLGELGCCGLGPAPHSCSKIQLGTPAAAR